MKWVIDHFLAKWVADSVFLNLHCSIRQKCSTGDWRAPHPCRLLNFNILSACHNKADADMKRPYSLRCAGTVLALLCAGVEGEYLCQTYYKPAQIVGIWISKPKQQNNVFFLILEGNSWATLTSNIFFTSNVCGVQPSKCDISCPHWIAPYYMVLPMCHYYAQYGVLLLFTLAVKSFVQLFRHHNSFKENKSYY